MTVCVILTHKFGNPEESLPSIFSHMQANNLDLHQKKARNKNQGKLSHNFTRKTKIQEHADMLADPWLCKAPVRFMRAVCWKVKLYKRNLCKVSKTNINDFCPH